MIQLSFGNHNPDVLTCIANLSNDEVFTPPNVANAMLDQVAEAWAKDHEGADIWKNPEVTFLDPFTKSGVFLREITHRLVEGLSTEIPDLQERVNHILTRQVFGIAITNLTALLSRRSVYCSKWASGEHSICRDFDNDNGNIWFERTEHTWAGGTKEFRVNPLTSEEEVVYVNRQCSFCGAGEAGYSRGDDRETHAYAFIHTNDIKTRLNEMFGGEMHFDVVVGNPPYQLNDGGFGKSAAPIYQLFVEQAKKLDPSYLSMIIPSRWFAGGKGLDDFRESMLTDKRMRHITDYIDSDEAFPGVDLAGGVSYFLWEKDNPGLCEVETKLRGETIVTSDRKLDEYDVFIRYGEALSILRKIWPDGVSFDQTLGSRMSGRNAFGFSTNAKGKSSKSGLKKPISLVGSSGTTFVEEEDVSSNKNWVKMWKSTVSRASPAGGRPDKNGQFYGLSSIRVIPPDSVTTEAYPVVSAFETRPEAENMCSYLRTKFVRFLLTLRSANQSVGKSTFAFVPILPMQEKWTDSLLYEKYNLTQNEIDFVESMVRPMDGGDE